MPIRRLTVAPRSLGAALLLGAAFLPGLAAAQEDFAPQAQVTVTQQLAVDDGNVIGITPIDMALQTGTRSQNLSFGASVPLRQGDPEDDSFLGLGDTQAQLEYRRFVRNSSIEVQGRYVEADLDQLIFFDNLIDDIVTLDGGRRADAGLRAGYAFGTQAKFGGEFSVGYLDRRYSGTTDPDLTDSVTVDGAATIFLEPTPLIRARILASALETDSEDGGTDTRRHRFGAGASLQANRQVNLDVELAHSRIRREDQSDGTVEESDGLSFRSALTYLRPDGDVTLSFNTDPGTEGRRDRIGLGRSFERPGYDFSVSAGVTRLDEGDLDPTFGFNYSTNASRVSQIQIGLQREAISDIDGNEAINTSLTSSYNRQLSTESSIGISLFHRDSNVQSGDAEDARSTALNISYNRSIGRDISAVAGVNIVRSQESDGLRDDEERIFVGLGRAFNFLP